MEALEFRKFACEKVFPGSPPLLQTSRPFLSSWGGERRLSYGESCPFFPGGQKRYFPERLDTTKYRHYIDTRPLLGSREGDHQSVPNIVRIHGSSDIDGRGPFLRPFHVYSSHTRAIRQFRFQEGRKVPGEKYVESAGKLSRGWRQKYAAGALQYFPLPMPRTRWGQRWDADKGGG